MRTGKNDPISHFEALRQLFVTIQMLVSTDHSQPRASGPQIRLRHGFEQGCHALALVATTHIKNERRVLRNQKLISERFPVIYQTLLAKTAKINAVVNNMKLVSINAVFCTNFIRHHAGVTDHRPQIGVSKHGPLGFHGISMVRIKALPPAAERRLVCLAMAQPCGMNAIAHAVEGLYARDRNPIASLMALEGIRALAHALAAGVDVFKPSLRELRQLTGQPLVDENRVPYTRASGLADHLEDFSFLWKWKMRGLAKGLADRIVDKV